MPLRRMDFLLSLIVLSSPLPWVMVLQAKWRESFTFVGAIVACLTLQLVVALALASAGWLDPAVVLALALLAWAGGVGSWWARRGAMGAPHRDREESRRDAATALGVGCVAVLFGTAGWLALSLPVTNFDSLAYHLPSLAHWVQTESVQPVDHLGLQRCYPLSSIALALPMASVANTDLPASLFALVALVMLLAAVFRLARTLGAGSAPAVAAVALMASSPVVLRSTEGVQPDLLLAALFTAALVEWISYCRTRGTGHLLTAVLAVCLLPGVKTSGIVYAALLILFALRTGRGPTRALSGSLGRLRTVSGGVVVGTGLGVAGFWYLRAWITCGSPVSLGGGAVGEAGGDGGAWSAAEILRTTVAGAFRPSVGQDWSVLGRILVDGLGAPLLLLLGLGLVGLILRLSSPRISTARGPIDSCGVLALACLGAYLFTPFSADNGGHGFRLTLWSATALRYALPLWSLAVALSAAEISALPRGAALAAGLAGVATGVALRVQLSLAWFDALVSIGWVLLAAVVWLRWAPRRLAPGVALAGSVVILGASALVAAPQRERLRDRAYGSFFAEVQERVPTGEPVAFHALERPYPLYGPDLRRPVVGWPAPRRGRRLWQEEREAWRAEARRWVDSLPPRGVRHLVTRDRDPLPEWDGRGAELSRMLAADPRWRRALTSDDESYLSLFVRSDEP